MSLFLVLFFLIVLTISHNYMVQDRSKTNSFSPTRTSYIVLLYSLKSLFFICYSILEIKLSIFRRFTIHISQLRTRQTSEYSNNSIHTKFVLVVEIRQGRSIFLTRSAIPQILPRNFVFSNHTRICSAANLWSGNVTFFFPRLSNTLPSVFYLNVIQQKKTTLQNYYNHT